MLAHKLPLFFRKRTGFLQNLAGHDDLSDIMQNGPKFQNGDILGIPVQRESQVESQAADTFQMTGGIRITRLNNICQHDHRLKMSCTGIKKLDNPAPVKAGTDRIN